MIKRSGKNAQKFTDPEVKDFRDRFAKGEITLKEISAQKNVSESIVRYMLSGKNYRYAGGYCSKIENNKAKVST